MTSRFRKDLAAKMALATILAANGFRGSPPARLFRKKEESSRRMTAAERKRELRRQRNIRDAANIQTKEKVRTP